MLKEAGGNKLEAAKRAYAWSHPDGVDDFDEKLTAVLEVPPLDSAKTAVQFAIVADFKRHQSNQAQ
jgi:hypothetical protein